MAKHRHEILSDEAADFVRTQALVAGEESPVAPPLGEEVDLELSAEQRRAMVAAGWISEPLDADDKPSSSKGGKG